MRLPLLRTISGRIILGFFVLILTFGAITFLTVRYMDELSREIRIIRTGYLQLALTTKDLSEKQLTLRSYLTDELVGESTPTRVEQRLRRMKTARTRLLKEAETILLTLKDVPERHEKRMAWSRDKVAEISRAVDQLEAWYNVLLKAPPIDRMTALPDRPAIAGDRENIPQVRAPSPQLAADGGPPGGTAPRPGDGPLRDSGSPAATPGAPVQPAPGRGPIPPLPASAPSATPLPGEPNQPSQLNQALEALERLRTSEAQILALTSTLERRQRELVESTARSLERNERRLRLFSLFMGLTAVFMGLLVTLWATLTLRPLRRLRDAARRIASGDYASRITEDGPREVADLAREFNVMGDAIDERERELVRSERLVAVGKMASMITHEVRNPLSSIGLNTELLEEEIAELSGGSSAEARALCRAIHTEIDRLTAITEEYLQFSRLPKPRLALESVNAIASSLVSFERESLEQKNVTLLTELDESIPPILIDDAQLRQVLLNLIRNAADALPEGGTISISTRTSKTAPEIEIDVCDSGPGIPEDLRTKVFDPFFSTKDGGTGLGLALTHQIVREHGGDIRVGSGPEGGARFTVCLPLRQASEPSA